MVKPSEGAVCDSCFMGCDAIPKTGGWRFPCTEEARRYAELQRAMGYPDDFRLEWERLVRECQSTG